MISKPILTVLVTTLVLTACDGGDEPAEPCRDPVPTTSVELADFVFRPNCLSTDAGATITLENTGDVLHTFTIEGTDIDFELDAGTSANASLSGLGPGRYAVTCTLHPQMEATLTVG
jgi:plastocyanin